MPCLRRHPVLDFRPQRIEPQMFRDIQFLLPIFRERAGKRVITNGFFLW
jgi:hypothetical protein